jgi:predicted enzyme related to lactoylglutathione lyase
MAEVVPLRGKLVWYEHLTTDMKAAESFYNAVVGWDVSPFEANPIPYDILTAPDGEQIGGVMTLPDGMNVPPHWVMYVGVDKLEDAVADIERHGGSAMSPVIEVPEVGRIRTMLDPQKAMFSIIEPASSERAPDREPTLGHVGWHELYTTDAPAAMKFYTAVFGWRPTAQSDMGPMGTYYMFGRTSTSMGGMMTKTAEMANVPNAWTFYFVVPDINAAVERVKAKGGQVLNGPMEVPGGDLIAQCMDPQGAAFSLVQRKAS